MANNIPLAAGQVPGPTHPNYAEASAYILHPNMKFAATTLNLLRNNNGGLAANLQQITRTECIRALKIFTNSSLTDDMYGTGINVGMEKNLLVVLILWYLEGHDLDDFKSQFGAPILPNQLLICLKAAPAAHVLTNVAAAPLIPVVPLVPGGPPGLDAQLKALRAQVQQLQDHELDTMRGGGLRQHVFERLSNIVGFKGFPEYVDTVRISLDVLRETRAPMGAPAQVRAAWDPTMRIVMKDAYTLTATCLDDPDVPRQAIALMERCHAMAQHFYTIDASDLSAPKADKTALFASKDKITKFVARHTRAVTRPALPPLVDTPTAVRRIRAA